MNYQKTAAHYAGIAHGLNGIHGSAYSSLKLFLAHYEKTSLLQYGKSHDGEIDPRSSTSINPLPVSTYRDSLSTHPSSSQRELASLYNIKRKLEDECQEERSVRRKLQRSLDEVQEELKKSKALLEFKQSQIKTEVDSRRGAEKELKRVQEDAKQRVDVVKRESARNTMLGIAAQ